MPATVLPATVPSANGLAPCLTHQPAGAHRAAQMCPNIQPTHISSEPGLELWSLNAAWRLHGLAEARTFNPSLITPRPCEQPDLTAVRRYTPMGHNPLIHVIPECG